MRNLAKILVSFVVMAALSLSAVADSEKLAQPKGFKSALEVELSMSALSEMFQYYRFSSREAKEILLHIYESDGNKPWSDLDRAVLRSIISSYYKRKKTVLPESPIQRMDIRDLTTEEKAFIWMKFVSRAQTNVDVFRLVNDSLEPVSAPSFLAGYENNIEPRTYEIEFRHEEYETSATVVASQINQWLSLLGIEHFELLTAKVRVDDDTAIERELMKTSGGEKKKVASLHSHISRKEVFSDKLLRTLNDWQLLRAVNEKAIDLYDRINSWGFMPGLENYGLIRRIATNRVEIRRFPGDPVQHYQDVVELFTLSEEQAVAKMQQEINLLLEKNRRKIVKQIRRAHLGEVLNTSALQLVLLAIRRDPSLSSDSLIQSLALMAELRGGIDGYVATHIYGQLTSEREVFLEALRAKFGDDEVKQALLFGQVNSCLAVTK